MIFYTSDQHFGHYNVIRNCNRPFSSVEEMDEYMIAQWNTTVRQTDEVYILGDFIYRSSQPPENYLRRLNGKKHLFLGNHDRHWFEKMNPSDWFESVDTLRFCQHGGRKLALCHYPMMSWPGGRGTYLLFGHLHNGFDMPFWPLIAQNELMLNVGVDVNDFRPVAFEKLQENNACFKAYAARERAKEEEPT